MLISQLNIVLVYKYRLFGRMLLEIAFMVLFVDENTHTHIYYLQHKRSCLKNCRVLTRKG